MAGQAFQGEKVKFQGQLRGQALTVSQLEIAALANQPPVSLVGEFMLPLVPDGLPVSGHAAATLRLPQEPSLVDCLNILTQGDAGKANAVLTIGPGKLSMDSSEMPLQLTGEAKQKDLIFYAVLPAMFRGSLADPQLTFR